MKTKLLFLATVLFNLTYAGNTGLPDNQNIPTNQAKLLPDVDVLYFNQIIDFSLPAGSSDVIDHVEFNRGSAIISSTGFKLNVNYANLLECEEMLQVYMRDAQGNVKLGYQKQISLKQKLSDRHDESVGNAKNIFELDGEIQPLDNIASKDALLNAHRLSLNLSRFEPDNITLSAFDMEIETATRAQIFHSATGEITEEMKAAIQKMEQGTEFKFTHIITTYTDNRQQIEMNLNYDIKYRIGTIG